MKLRKQLHVAGPCYASNGGSLSMLAIMEALAETHDLEFWSTAGDIAPELGERLACCCRAVHEAAEGLQFPADSHVLFYPSDLTLVFANRAAEWQAATAGVASVQTIVTFNIGALALSDWLAAKSTCVYFEDSDTESIWRHMAARNAWRDVPTLVLASPVDLDAFLRIRARTDPPLVVGRLAGHQPLPMDAGHFYQQLSRRLPEAEFWFMPAPDRMPELFARDPRFRFFDEGAMDAARFLEQIDIMCLPVKANTSMHGPRVLIEAMAAGRPAVTVAWHGPKDRIGHGVSGFITNDLDEMADYVLRLAADPALRRRVGEAARERARGWKIQSWAEAIAAHCVPADLRRRGARVP